MTELPDGIWDVILADPPWSYYGLGTKWAAAAKEYDCMADGALTELPMADLLAKNGVLFLWATGPRLDIAMRCIASWGLHYRGMAFVWVKTRKDGITPVGAQGVRPSIVKPTTEFVLAASKQATGRPMPLADESVRQVVLAPKREHSRKPDEVIERIEKLYPNATKLEMFCRGVPAPGWDGWGDECIQPCRCWRSSHLFSYPCTGDCC